MERRHYLRIASVIAIFLLLTACGGEQPSPKVATATPSATPGQVGTEIQPADRGGLVPAPGLVSTAYSGSYNVPQTVRLESTPDATIYYTLDGSDPLEPGRRSYSRPLIVTSDTVLRAKALLPSGESQELRLEIRILKEPTSRSRGFFLQAHPAPIYQDVTRTAFLYVGPSGGGPEIHFSTIERYHSPPGDQFVFYKYNLSDGRLDSITVPGSIEARSYAYSSLLNRFILGASLDPQVLLYDPATQHIEQVFYVPIGTWLHQIATDGRYAYTILSTPGAAIKGFDGILKIDLVSKEWEVIPFTDRRPQNYGGVESVDPVGRIWFWREYPRFDGWYDVRKGMGERRLDGYPGWRVESWDIWGDSFYLILTQEDGAFLKKRVDPKTLAPLDEPCCPADEATRLFEKLRPVDLNAASDSRHDFHQGSPAIAHLYYDQATKDYYQVDPIGRTILLLGRVDMKNFQVLGLVSSEELIGWLEGQKRFARVALPQGEMRVGRISAPNISPGDVRALTVGRDGMVYGAGTKTISNLFRFDPQSGEVALLEQAIPAGVGSVTALALGSNGLIYGVGYSDSVPFMYDPSLPWDPLVEAESNPTNLGKVGYYNQTRPSSPVVDSDGNLWYLSVTDYSLPIANAVVKADFRNRRLTVKTDLDDGFPVANSLVQFDGERMLLVGEKGGVVGLYLLDKRSFTIVQERSLSAEKERRLFDLGSSSANFKAIYLTEGANLYRVLDDLSLYPVHRAIGPIARVVRGNGDNIILLGKNYIEMVDNQTGRWEVWWDGGEREAGQVFLYLDYAPVVYYQGRLLLAYEFELRWFYPPEGKG